MVPTDEIKRIKTRPDRINYTGKMDKLQVEGSSHKGRRYTSYEDNFNEHQKFLYKRALFGLAIYSESELVKMHYQKKKRIREVHQKTRYIINLWKQVIVNKLTVRYFKTGFPDHKDLAKLPTLKQLILKKEIDPGFQCNLSLKSVGITDKQIANVLIKCRILPSNFYELKPTRNDITRPVK